jgi:hypothetical protein
VFLDPDGTFDSEDDESVGGFIGDAVDYEVTESDED